MLTTLADYVGPYRWPCTLAALRTAQARRWIERDALGAMLVCPEPVAEISADRAIHCGGVFRHPLRFQRRSVG
ncbi:hypothetical protein [Streptomyces vinaceus]|uniref:hypothetical protein n=1 Tax=Streptomyces vinaceus TaxID=1960 RepID=UPI00367E0710